MACVPFTTWPNTHCDGIKGDALGCEVSVGWAWGQYEASIRSANGRPWVNVGSLWGQYGISVRSVRDQCGINAGFREVFWIAVPSNFLSCVPLPLGQTHNVLFWGVKSALGELEVNVRSVWDQCRVSVKAVWGSVWGQYKVCVGSVWGQYGISVGVSVGLNDGGSVRSVWGLCGINVRSVWDQWGVGSEKCFSLPYRAISLLKYS